MKTDIGDPEYTPNTPAPQSSSSGGLSTSGYIAIAGVGGLIIFIAIIAAWCIIVRRRRRRERAERRAAHLERERRRERGKEVPSRSDQRYRDAETGMIDLDSIRAISPQSHAYSYNYRPPPTGRTHPNSSLIAQTSHHSPSHVSPTSTANTKVVARRYSANNLVPPESVAPYTYSINQVQRLSLQRSPTRLSVQAIPAPTITGQESQVSRRHSLQSIPTTNQSRRHSMLRKPSPVQQARYEEKKKVRSGPTPTPTYRSTPTPPVIPQRRWKIFRKSTYRRRMEVREIDIHDVNRHKTSSTRKMTASSSATVGGTSAVGGTPMNRNVSTSTGAGTTVVDVYERRDTSYTDNSKEMRGGGSVMS
ncbi:hypothetical protein ABW19_dt0205211 [Dactylella cylindrospora]|nr:hypothetical protein ABW19_dt0205211 [Dactylella cylindrospora]